MDFIMSRFKGLFEYGDLEGSNNRGSKEDGPESLDLGSEADGIVSANRKVRRRRRCVWLTSIVCGLIAVVIIAAALKNRRQLKEAASAILHSVDEDQSPRTEARTDVRKDASGKRKMTFKDFLHYSFYPDHFNGTWISSSELLFPDQFGGLSITDMDTSTTSTVISHNQFTKLRPVTYQFSADRKYLLVKTAEQKVWRRSSIGTYGLLKMNNQGRPSSTATISLAPPGDIKENDLDLNSYLRYVSWAPVGNALAYVDYNNNIHYRHSAEGEDMQLTTSGVVDTVYNGIPDWVSEEEVFEDNKALWWSPDGSKLVYGVFNDTLVQTVNLPRYGNWRNKPNRQGYPFLQYHVHDQFKYPKAGTTNPTVTLWYADVGPPGSQNEITQERLPPPQSMQTVEHHFTAVTWQSNTTVAVNWMNRIQNESALALCPLAEEEREDGCKEVFLTMERDGWIDYKFRVVFNKFKETKRFLAILPAASMRYRLRQMFLIDTKENKRTLLTKEFSEVTEILAWTADDVVYYIATLPDSPGSRHLFRLSLSQPDTECLSCRHQEMVPHLKQRENCDYVEVSMSWNNAYYVLKCQGPGLPYSCVHNTESNSLLSVWTDNLKLEKRLEKVSMPRVEYLEVPVAGSNQKAQVLVHVPPEAEDKSIEDGSLPLLVDVYGGPGFQKVNKKWQNYEFGAYLASSFGIAYAVVDPRGSGFQGDAWRHAVYRNFGSVEVTDTVSVTASLQELLPYVNPSLTGLWGWSYGGFLTLSALSKDKEGVIKCGTSVAPVVKWELYDTVYTERYMSTPQDNPSGYNSSTPLWDIGNLKNKKYYLIHGTHDDNVHYQQSMLLSAALEEKDILFRQQAYPDQDHSLGNYRRHLYHSLTDFFTNDCFRLNDL